MHQLEHEDENNDLNDEIGSKNLPQRGLNWFPVVLGGVPNELSSFGGRSLVTVLWTRPAGMNMRAGYVHRLSEVTRVVLLFCLFYFFLLMRAGLHT